jgi:hypothetical protein
VLAPPHDATLKVVIALSKKATGGLGTLEIGWTEGCGSVPIGPLASGPDVNDKVLVGQDGLPRLFLVQRIGDRLTPLSLEAPRLLLPKPSPNGHTESMSLYVVCKWDLLKSPGDGADAAPRLSLDDAGPPLTLNKNNVRMVYSPQPPAPDGVRIYELPATLFTKDEIPYTSWNIEWTKDGAATWQLFSAASPISQISADTTEPPRVAAVLRAAVPAGALGTSLDRTLFYGAAASSRSFSPSIQPAEDSAPPRLVLDARGSETVVASIALIDAAKDGTITLVKYFRDGSTIAAVANVSPAPAVPA